MPSPLDDNGKNALVLAGGAARGAYEVGVVDYILRDVARDLGAPIRFDILCGTSVGALNSCMLAALAHEPGPARAGMLVDHWRRLRIEELIRLSPGAMLRETVALFGYEEPVRAGERRRGGVLDPTGIEQLVTRSIPFSRIGENLRSGHLDAVTVSTTHVGSGRTIVFVDRASSERPTTWGADPTVVARAASLRAEHALASSAIPFLFPAVRIGSEFHCDGGLRQNVPLSPARRLGATGLIVVSPRNIDTTEPDLEHAREEDFPSAVFLLGKALNALLLDRVENDIDRLKRINAILEAGVRHYGPSFLTVINHELRRPSGIATRPLRTVLIRASQNIGRLASEFVRANRFLSRPRGLLGWVIDRFAASTLEADALSYVLFDGHFAAELIELGRVDARARHEELCSFFAARTEPAG
jgi:NTE family protein